MSRFLEEFAQKVREMNAPVFSVAEMVGENAPEMVQIVPNNACQNGYSISKAYVVTGLGMLFDRGMLRVEEKIADIFRDELPENIDPMWENVTVEHVLLHKCALPPRYLDIDLQDIAEYGTDDFLRYIFDTRLTGPVGEEYCYTDAAYYLLSRVFTKKCGEKLDDYLWRELFYPLGMREAAWSHCPKGYPMGATGLYMRAQDCVKLGGVYLHGGVYEGRRYLSEEWVNLTLSCGYELKPLCGGKAWGKGGMYGQQLMAVPGEDRAVCWHAFGGYDKDGLIDWVANWKK